MVSTEQLLAFGIAAAVLIAIPGPSVVFVVGRALAYGRGVALATVVGNSLGLLVVLALVAVGLGVVVQESIAVFTVLKLLGAAYLVYLGVHAVRHRHAFTVADRRTTDVVLSRRRAVRQGFVVGVSNPKAFMIFAAVLPQFVDRGQGHVAAQMLVLGLVFNAIAVVSDSTWGLVAATARDWFARSPRRLSVVGGVGGLTLIGLGVTVAVTGRKD
jgi:threonine/homoserine/homoserine lactone efflux protein